MRELLVFGTKTFKISVPDDAKVTFGPWSPPKENAKYGGSDRSLEGTLRVYESAKAGASILAVFSGVTGYRDMALAFAEEVVREEGATIWKTDRDGYKREDAVTYGRDWVDPTVREIEAPKRKPRKA